MIEYFKNKISQKEQGFYIGYIRSKVNEAN